jgi:hypothetical protein
VCSTSLTRSGTRRYSPMYGRHFIWNILKCDQPKTGSLHDNVLAHWSLLVQQHFSMHGTVGLFHTDHIFLIPHSVTFSFCVGKWWPNGCHPTNTVEVKVVLKIMLQNVTDGGFQKCFEKLYKLYQDFIGTEGQYFESSCV